MKVNFIMIKKFKKVYILDPGLQIKSGSNYDVVKKLSAFLKKEGCEIFILISKNHKEDVIKSLTEKKIRVIPIFAVSPYNSLLFTKDKKKYFFMIKQTISDLNNVKKQYGKADFSIWSVPMSPIQLISNLFVKVSKINIYNVELTPQNFSDLAIICYKKFKKKFLSRNDILYLSRDDFTEKILKNFLSIRMERYPQLTDSYSKTYLKNIEKRFKVGIFGVKEMIQQGIFEDIIKKLLNMGFRIFIQDPKGLVTNKFDEEINISFFKYEKKISDIFEQIDFGIYFFNPIRYKLLVSGIVCEAISFGLPIIVPKDNLASETQQIYNCEMSFDWQNSDELFKKINYFIKDFEVIKKISINASKVWNSKEGTDKYIKKLFKEKLIDSEKKS